MNKGIDMLKNRDIPSTTGIGWNFDNSYARLPALFYVAVKPTPVRKPQIALFNTVLADDLGLSPTALTETGGASFFSGNQLPEGATPIAQAYAGHQFGYFTMLGDGRAILLGEQIAPDGKRYDIQLKGAGQTPYSRRGDGRAALGPMLREYLISEAMHALGIPTTRSLAVVTTGESVFRDMTQPGAILTRVAASHIRVGTFEYTVSWGDDAALKTLADYTLQRHYPELLEADNPYLALLYSVIERQAALIAKWQLVGFIHGVMNTDNMAISGESIDYGPCAFMDTYDPATVFSSIDAQGRYAYSNQPRIAQWNLARFAEALLPLLHSEKEKALELGREAINAFPERFESHWLSGMRAKLGLFTTENDDKALIDTLLNWMHQHQADYTNTFRALSADTLFNEPLFKDAGFTEWYTRWQARLARQTESQETGIAHMQAHNPQLIPRNHLVEEALQAATEGDFSVLERFLQTLKAPFAPLSPENHFYSEPPAPNAAPYKTFCGT
jgi:uncharacterized protein YdiU (UPF0061 family)